jgi:hypothetical protein
MNGQQLTPSGWKRYSLVIGLAALAAVALGSSAVSALLAH